jgi:hypothetical protein
MGEGTLYQLMTDTCLGHLLAPASCPAGGWATSCMGERTLARVVATGIRQPCWGPSEFTRLDCCDVTLPTGANVHTVARGARRERSRRSRIGG